MLQVQRQVGFGGQGHWYAGHVGGRGHLATGEADRSCAPGNTGAEPLNIGGAVTRGVEVSGQQRVAGTHGLQWRGNRRHGVGDHRSRHQKRPLPTQADHHGGDAVLDQVSGCHEHLAQ